MSDELIAAARRIVDRPYQYIGGFVQCSATPADIRKLRELCGAIERDDMQQPELKGVEKKDV